MNPTIYDVSRLSGVSTATISRAFSEPEKVREGTRRKVYEAAAALHYSPNAIARAMARQRTDKIAFLICKKGATILDEFYASICEGIMRETNGSDYLLLISTAEDWSQASATAQSKQVEGVILGGDAQAELVSEFQSKNVAVVLVNNRMAGFDLPCVVSDERGGVRQAVEHLMERGHRRIGMLAGRLAPYITSQRYSAFLEVMADHGLPVRDEDIKMCDLDIRDATRAAQELLDRPDRPSAIFAANDIIAAATVKAAARLHLRVPEDLAVVGYDDSTACALTEPELTSVHIDCRQMGLLCVERLKAVLCGEEHVPRLTVVPTRLVVRRSS